MDDEFQRQFAALGVTVEVDEEPEEDGMPIAAENWNSVKAFLACETQWRVVGTMRQLVWLGLDYVAVKVLADLEGWAADIFADIRIMEAAALPTLNEVD